MNRRKKYIGQESIPAGCIPSAAVADEGVYAREVCLPGWGWCLPGGCNQTCTGTDTPPPRGQNDRRL